MEGENAINYSNFLNEKYLFNLFIKESHLKTISSDSKPTTKNVQESEASRNTQNVDTEMLLEPVINDEYINPIKPMILELPTKVIYKGIVSFKTN